MTTIDRYRAMLPVMKHRLDDELEIQPDIMDRIATQVVIRNSQMLQAKDDLSKVEARLLEAARDLDPKITVAGAEAKVKRNPERARAWEKFQEARAEHETWAFLLEAWRQKGYSIKVLADLYQAQYYTVDTHHLSDRQRERLARGDEARADSRKDHGAKYLNVREDGIHHEDTKSKATRRSIV